MDWVSIATFATAIVAFAGLNLGALKWLLDRHDSAAQQSLEKVAEVEKSLYQLKERLPLEYVRREDWIRFSNVIEAKTDAMRSELRAEMAELKAQLLKLLGRGN